MPASRSKQKVFYGWLITAAAFCTFGISVGFPYYNIPFFFDYFESPPEQGGFGWSREQVTLGFPLSALLTLWVGPLLVHRFSPRKAIVFGTGLIGLALIGFGRMGGEIWLYYLFWFVSTVGYIFSGPIPHQVIISQWFRRLRGRAMGVTYVGVAVFGSAGSYLVKPLVEGMGFHTALQIMGVLLLLAWPFAIFILRDRPADMGLQPDGEEPQSLQAAEKPQGLAHLLRQPAFYLLAIGSFCSIGSIGAVNQHMKLVFKDQGFVEQEVLNSVWRTASISILWASIAGRLGMGWAADRFSKKYVMVITYVLVAMAIPLLLLVTPERPAYVYIFAILFGVALGADYMLIPLMAADQFGVPTLVRAMGVILPFDTIGQTWFPYFVSVLRRRLGGYDRAFVAVFALAMAGAAAIALLPKRKRSEGESSGQDSTSGP